MSEINLPKRTTMDLAHRVVKAGLTLIPFLGQMRDRLIMFLMDRHERIVPPIMDWWLTECDINKDIKVSHMLHFTGIKIQVKHLDHLFKVYVKPMGKDTACRVDETKSFEKKNPIQVIDELYNPNQVLANRIDALDKKIDRLSDILAKPNALKGIDSCPPLT